MLAKAAVASQFPGFSRWAFAQHSDHESGAAPSRAEHYQPSYFSDAEYRTIDILTGLIIPADDTPGAREAGVAEFIDFMAAHGEKEIQQPFREGLQWLNVTSQKAHNANFSSLSPGQQTDILKAVAYRNTGTQADEVGRKFFQLLRRYTVMGYYTSRIGMKELDYPGLKAYSESPSCPHTNDPEHRHLPAPVV